MPDKTTDKTAQTRKNEGLTRKQTADHFQVSVSTIRAWQRQFKAWLEVEKQAYGGGRRHATLYTDNDLTVFSVVAKLTKEGLSYGVIRERLDQELTSATFKRPDERDKEPEEREQTTALVSMEEHSRVLLQLGLTTGKLEAKEEENERLLDRVDKLERNQSEERERHQQRMDKIQEQLDEERAKSWWDKLRGR